MERDEADAIFHSADLPADGDGFVPTALARGPWDPNAQHGGAPSAILARAIERHDPEPPMQVARLTIELLRPVPLGPLSVRTRTVRPGKRVQLVEAGLRSPTSRAGSDARCRASSSTGPDGCSRYLG
jgi:hypothetical protein